MYAGDHAAAFCTVIGEGQRAAAAMTDGASNVAVYRVAVQVDGEAFIIAAGNRNGRSQVDVPQQINDLAVIRYHINRFLQIGVNVAAYPGDIGRRFKLEIFVGFDIIIIIIIGMLRRASIIVGARCDLHIAVAVYIRGRTHRLVATLYSRRTTRDYDFSGAPVFNCRSIGAFYRSAADFKDGCISYAGVSPNRSG